MNAQFCIYQHCEDLFWSFVVKTYHKTATEKNSLVVFCWNLQPINRELQYVRKFYSAVHFFFSVAICLYSLTACICSCLSCTIPAACFCWDALEALLWFRHVLDYKLFYLHLHWIILDLLQTTGTFLLIKKWSMKLYLHVRKVLPQFLEIFLHFYFNKIRAKKVVFFYFLLILWLIVHL